MDTTSHNTQNNLRSGLPTNRWLDKVAKILHPGVLVVTSLVLAGAIFLTDSEQRALVGSDAALFKLFAGALLLYFLGSFVVQQRTFREHSSEIDLDYEIGSKELAGKLRALREKIERNHNKAT